jgi:hypothetical protein
MIRVRLKAAAAAQPLTGDEASETFSRHLPLLRLRPALELVQDTEASTLAGRMHPNYAGCFYVSFPPIADTNLRSGRGDRVADGAGSQPQT